MEDLALAKNLEERVLRYFSLRSTSKQNFESFPNRSVLGFFSDSEKVKDKR